MDTLQPFDDSGSYKDENITAYRYALAESDSLPIEEQYRILRESKLPIAALVESGGKSSTRSSGLTPKTSSNTRAGYATPTPH